MSAVAMRYGTLTAICGTVLIALAGCGGDGTVLTGKVTVHGKPLEAGSIVVRDEKGKISLGEIRNGEYRVGGTFQGQLKIAVTAAEVPRSAAGGTKADMKNRMSDAANNVEEPVRYVADIPSVYQDPETTPITHEISSGSTKDIIIPQPGQ